MNTPRWVQQAIATRTGLPPRRGRAARAGICRTCRQPTLTGLDEDTCAFQATTDTQPLTTVGEAQALLTGRTTYTLYGRPPELLRRDQWRIKNHPAGEVVVLPEHQCGATPLHARTIPPAQQKKKDNNNACPF